MLAVALRAWRDGAGSKTTLLLELESAAAATPTSAARRPCWSSTKRRACRRSARGDSAAREHRDRRREAAVGDSRRSAGAGGPLNESRCGSSSSASRCAASCGRLTPRRRLHTSPDASAWPAASAPACSRARPSELIHERSAGMPRTISVIADNALLAGLPEAERPVDERGDRRRRPRLRIWRSRHPQPGAAEPAPLFCLTQRRRETNVAVRSRCSRPRKCLTPNASPTSNPNRCPPETPSFGTFSPKRRFPFFGRRGTA